MISRFSLKDTMKIIRQDFYIKEIKISFDLVFF